MGCLFQCNPPWIVLFTALGSFMSIRAECFRPAVVAAIWLKGPATPVPSPMRTRAQSSQDACYPLPGSVKGKEYGDGAGGGRPRRYGRRRRQRFSIFHFPRRGNSLSHDMHKTKNPQDNDLATDVDWIRVAPVLRARKRSPDTLPDCAAHMVGAGMVSEAVFRRRDTPLVSHFLPKWLTINVFTAHS